MARRPGMPADAGDVIRGATYFLVRSAFPSDAAIAEFAGVDRSRVTRFKQGKNLEPETDALMDAVSARAAMPSRGSSRPPCRSRAFSC